jgi:hypothetical protein
MGLRRFNVLCTCVLVPIMAAGQTAARACDPMAPPAQVIRVARMLYGQVRVPRGAAASVQSYARQLLRAFADRFTLPNPLKLGAWGSVTYERKDELSGLPIDSGWIHPDLPLAAYVVINRNGTLRRVVVAQTTLVPGLDSALLAPFEAVVDTSLLPAVLLEGTRDSVVLYFETSIDPRGAADLDSAALVQPLVQVSLPHVRLQRRPRLVNGSRNLPYPTRGGQFIAADGMVHVQLTVGVDGVVAPGSIRLRDATSPEFVQEVFDEAARMRFEPATSGDCAIAMVIDETFRFRHSYIIR